MTVSIKELMFVVSVGAWFLGLAFIVAGVFTNSNKAKIDGLVICQIGEALLWVMGQIKW